MHKATKVIASQNKNQSLIRQIKQFSKRFRIVMYAYSCYERLRAFFVLRKMRSTEEVFTHHFEKRYWGDGETVSGSGSTLEYTQNLRKELPERLNNLGVRTVLDAPCGDYNWFKAMELGGEITYVGADIVTELVSRNQKLYGGDNTRFMELDIISDELPEIGQNSLWLCRDCLFHFSNESVITVLKKFSESSISYLLTSTHTENINNRDILTGDFRLLNLERPPFNLPKSKLYVSDWVEDSPVRYLALWTKQEVDAGLSKLAQ